MTTAAVSPSSVRPFWIPAGVDIDSLPEEVQAVIAAIINPAYHELALEAKPGLEQSTGLTIVHLLWLEVLDQLQLATSTNFSGLVGGNEDDETAAQQRGTIISRLLRVLGAKNQASRFLLQLRKRQSPLHALPVGPLGKPPSPEHEAAMDELLRNPDDPK